MWSLTTAAMPTSIEALAGAGRRRPRPTGRRRSGATAYGDERRQTRARSRRASRRARPHRSATTPQTRNDDGRRGRGQDADDADVGQRQVQPVDVDERVERERGDEAAAVEALGEGDAAEDRALAQGADRVARREPRRVARRPCARSPAYAIAQTEPDHARRGRPRSGHRAGRRRCPPASAASAPAAARPVPMTPTTRPRSRAGYIAPHRRRWNGPPNERLSQKTIETAIITGGVGRTTSSDQRGRADAADERELARRTAARPGRRTTPSRLAMNGAAASAARPDRLEAAAAGDRREEGRDEGHASRRRRRPRRGRARGCARPRADVGDGWSDGRNTTYLEAARLACEVSCRARRGFAVAVVRDLPRVVGPPSSSRRFGRRQRYQRWPDAADGPLVPGVRGRSDGGVDLALGGSTRRAAAR